MLCGVPPSVTAELIKQLQFHRRAFVDLSNESGRQGTKRPRSWMVFAVQVERLRLLRGVQHGGIHWTDEFHMCQWGGALKRLWLTHTAQSLEAIPMWSAADVCSTNKRRFCENHRVPKPAVTEHRFEPLLVGTPMQRAYFRKHFASPRGWPGNQWMVEKEGALMPSSMYCDLLC